MNKITLIALQHGWKDEVCFGSPAKGVFYLPTSTAAKRCARELRALGIVAVRNADLITIIRPEDPTYKDWKKELL